MNERPKEGQRVRVIQAGYLAAFEEGDVITVRDILDRCCFVGYTDKTDTVHVEAALGDVWEVIDEDV